MVETFTEFPASFRAGDTIRYTFSDSDFPTTLWTAKVVFQSATVSKTFSTTVSGTSYNLLITAAQSAQLKPDNYLVSFVYTETSTQERKTGDTSFSVSVLSDPTATPVKSPARKTLEAMEAAYLKLVSGSNQSVNFNGQSFTKWNLKDFMEAIELQRAIVAGEDDTGGARSHGRVLHPL